MAHFAKINKKGVVEEVLVIDNNSIENLEFPKSESKGQQFIKSIGFTGTWMQTSYNGNFRKNYAGIGYTYNKSKDAFIPPRPYRSWTLNEHTCLWEPPVPYPSDINNLYVWDEPTKTWIKT